MMILGILGLYIGNILAEVRQRPYTHLRAIHRVGPVSLPSDDKRSADQDLLSAVPSGPGPGMVKKI